MAWFRPRQLVTAYRFTACKRGTRECVARRYGPAIDAKRVLVPSCHVTLCWGHVSRFFLRRYIDEPCDSCWGGTWAGVPVLLGPRIAGGAGALHGRRRLPHHGRCVAAGLPARASSIPQTRRRLAGLAVWHVARRHAATR